jgi:hypothetical protein
VLLRMINSVGEYVAGQEYEVPTDEADRFVLLGYADGKLSRDYSDTERERLAATAQSVSL